MNTPTNDPVSESAKPIPETRWQFSREQESVRELQERHEGEKLEVGRKTRRAEPCRQP